jgi:hypothetical protein
VRARGGGLTTDALYENPGHLKVELSVRGLRLDAGLRDRLFEGTEARASTDIDLLLPEDVWVQAPIDERWTAGSPFTLAAEAGRFRLRRADRTPLEVRVLAPPDFYRRRTSEGRPMGQLAEVHGNFVAIDPAAACGFGSRGLPCAFCRGLGPAAAPTLPSVAEVVEVVRAAFDEGAAEFVYFRSRCSDAPDGGLEGLRPYILGVKKHFDTLIAAELDPPLEGRDVDRAYAAGIDAVSYNLEIFDPATLERVCPRRARAVGRDRYLEALRRAAAIFPAGTVWCELVVGVEPLDSTRTAIDTLTAMGVLPVLSVVGPAAADEAGLAPPSPEELCPVYAHLYEAVKRQRTPMTWVRDLPIGITPLDARFFVDESDRLAVTSFYRSRLGTLAARSLSRLRRRLRVKTVSESFDSSRL